MQKINKIKSLTLSNIAFANHSNNPNPLIRVGSVIKASNNMPSGIFYNTLIWIYQMRERRFKGVIINKKYQKLNEELFNIGGPCEVEEKQIILHNIPNINNSVQIMENLYYCEDEIETPNNLNLNEYKTKQFFGYAAWFQGQLDGELENNDWSIFNNYDSNSILNIEEVIEMI